MSSDAAQEIRFGEGGTDTHHLGAGWSGEEPGYRWSLGRQSELWLNNPGHATDLVLELEISPFVNPPALPRQSLSVFVRGALVGRAELTEFQTLGFRIPAAVVAAPGPVHVVFEHPDAASPRAHGHASDSRVLAFCFVRAALRPQESVKEALRIEGGEPVVAADIGRLTGMPAAQFMLRFESLGDNCEFGLVQRRCGAEPLGLLRFSNLELRQLLRGLENGFDGLGEIANMEFWLQPGDRPEYVVRDRSYALVFHTFIHEGDANEAELLAQQSTRLKFLRRKFLEDLANGEKVFVVKRNTPLTEPEVQALHVALLRHGRNTLLYVVPAEPERPPGTVERIAPGLLRGYIDRFAPPSNAHDLSLEVWLTLCMNAARIAGKYAEEEIANQHFIPNREDRGTSEIDAQKPSNLDKLGILAGTDKSSVLHDYLRHYERIFLPYRERKINVLEIGIAGGASLAMWSRYFRNANVIGIDIDSGCSRFATDRVIVRIGSQADESFLREVCQEFPPTIIIDDGSHLADHNRLTFEVAFPMLQSGGIYVIEDLYLHFGAGAEIWQGNSDKPPHLFINDLANKLMADSIDAGGESALMPFADQIDYITIMRRFAAFHKKSTNSIRRWEEMWPELETAKVGSNWFHLAATISAQGGRSDLAVAAARNAVTMIPEDIFARVRLVELLQQGGQPGRASEEAALTLKLFGYSPNIGEFRSMLEEAAKNGSS